MKRTLLFLLPLALVGCGPQPAPIIEARPIERPRVEDDTLKVPVTPDASDPDAKKLLAELLAAHTGGKPEALAPFKECTFTRSGFQEASGGRFPAVWTRHLSWPGGYRLQVILDLGNAAKQQIVFASGPSGAWRAAVGDKEKTSLDASNRGDVTAQLHEDALTLLFPLADPGVVVSKGEGKDASVTDLNAWVPGIGFVRLGVDAKTKLLVRLTYNGRENGAAVQKELSFQDFKEYAGVKLAAKLQVRTKAKTLGEWTDLTLDTTKPDAKLFDGP